MAAEIGIEIGTYYRIERGAQRPGLDVSIRLAAWLGWSVEQVADASRESSDPTDPSGPPTHLGALIRRRRGASSGASAASDVGIHPITLHKIERGTSRPSADTAAKLATWLGLTVGQVIDAAREPAGEGG